MAENSKKDEKKKKKVLKGEIIEASSSETIDSTNKPPLLKKPHSKNTSAQPFKNQSLIPQDTLALYMAEVKKHPLLTPEEEKDLTLAYNKTRDPLIAEKLVTSNLRFVVKVALEYTQWRDKLIDLIQEGNMGLMHAVKEFDPHKGTRLITYAVWWIRGYIQEYLMKQHSLVKIGTTQKQRKLFYRLQKEAKQIEQIGYNPVIKQLSSQLDISEKEVSNMAQRVSLKDMSLDQNIKESDKNTFLDYQEDKQQKLLDDLFEEKENLQLLKKNIEKLRPQLNEKELFLLENRILSDTPLTLQQIGEKRGVSREAVRQMEERLIKKIKNFFLEQIENKQIM